MPEIEIELEPIAEGQAELAREIGQLEAEGKRILDIRYPDWAADDLGIIPDAQTGNAGTYGAHRATQYTQPYPGRVAIIVYQDYGRASSVGSTSSSTPGCTRIWASAPVFVRNPVSPAARGRHRAGCGRSGRKTSC